MYGLKRHMSKNPVWVHNYEINMQVHSYQKMLIKSRRPGFSENM